MPLTNHIRAGGKGVVKPVRTRSGNAGRRFAGWRNPQNTIYSQRARTGPQEPAILRLILRGGAGFAVDIPSAISWNCHRLVHLRRHREDLAPAWNLRVQWPGNLADLHSPAGLPGISGAYFRLVWHRSLPSCAVRTDVG